MTDHHDRGSPTGGRRDEPTGGRLPVVPWRSIWRVIGAVLATAALLWALFEMRSLVAMILIAIFFSLAMEPAVRWLQAHRGWSRGAGVGAIYLGLLVFLLVMVVVLIPAIAELARRIGEQGPGWIADLNQWAVDTLGTEIVTDEIAESGASGIAQFAGGWADDIFGTVTGIASAGVGFVFSVATIAMFTFYFTSDSPRLTRMVLSWFPPRQQERLGWTLDQAVEQTGGYFYSRSILMVINGLGFFFVMVLVGMPVSFAIPLSVFGGFVSVFIPSIGTYIGAAVPILVTVAIQGLTAGLVILGYVLVYQQIENYWLSPKISAQTMELNGAVAFGAAIAGGSLAGPMGAFVALPMAALIVSFIKHYGTSYDVVYESASTRDHHDAPADDDESDDAIHG